MPMSPRSGEGPLPGGLCRGERAGGLLAMELHGQHRVLPSALPSPPGLACPPTRPSPCPGPRTLAQPPTWSTCRPGVRKNRPSRGPGGVLGPETPEVSCPRYFDRTAGRGCRAAVQCQAPPAGGGEGGGTGLGESLGTGTAEQSTKPSLGLEPLGSHLGPHLPAGALAALCASVPLWVKEGAEPWGSHVGS